MVAQTLDAAQQAVVQTPAVQLQLLLHQKLSSQHQLQKPLADPMEGAGFIAHGFNPALSD